LQGDQRAQHAPAPVPIARPLPSALESIKEGKARSGRTGDGEVPILGIPYITGNETGNEPIKDGSGAQIGVYSVSYKK